MTLFGTSGTQTEWLAQQYCNADNLNARIALHTRFGPPDYNWFRWVFEHFQIPTGSIVLELATGPGRLWVENQDRLPADWNIHLSDLSAGMVQEAERNLAQSQHPFRYHQIDAQAIPFEDQSLDIVIANHMLYHVPDRAKALSEIRRVLKPEGRFYAATNGDTHLHELRELMRPYELPAVTASSAGIERSFTLENGGVQIEQCFAHVEQYRQADQLVVTEVAPLLAYILSGDFKETLSHEQLLELQNTITQRIARDGAVRIQRVSGLFEAHGLKA